MKAKGPQKSGTFGFLGFTYYWGRSLTGVRYPNNYGELPFGGITSFTYESMTDKKLDDLISDHEVLAAGFPCQPFSHAGVSARKMANACPP